MSAPEVAIGIPSRCRPHRIRALVENIDATTEGPHQLYFAVADQESRVILDDMGVINWLFPPETSMVTKINFMLSRTTEPYFYGGQDDIVFRPGWLAPALAKCREVDGVVAISNGRGHYDSSIASRRYIEEEGTIDEPGLALHPGYFHYYSEVEHFHTALHRGRFAYCDESVIEHHHWLNGNSPDDETYRINRAAFAHDAALFAKRAHLWGGRTDHIGRPHE